MEGLAISLWRPRIVRDVATSAITVIPRGEYWETLVDLAAYTHTIQRIGGYETAEFSLALREEEVDAWIAEGLGLHVEVVDESLARIFEGFVDEVEVAIAGVRVVRGPLMDIGNRVKVIYTDTAYAEEGGVMLPQAGDVTETPWAEDAVSQLHYGVFEKNLQAGWLDDTSPGPNEAVQLRDLFLRENAWPFSSCLLEGGGEESGEITLTCRVRGYMARLDYLYNNTTPPANQLANGSFETLDTGAGLSPFAGWWQHLGGGTTEAIDVAVEPGEVVDGVYAAKLTSAEEGNTNLTTAWWTTPGVAYTVSVQCHGDGTNAPDIGLYDDTNDVDILARTSTLIPGAAYQEYSYSFVCPADCYVISLILWAPAPAGAYAYFDQVQVTHALDLVRTLSSKMAEILDDDRNGLFSSANAAIAPNGLLVPAYEDQDAEAWTLLRDLVNEGDILGNRYSLMVGDDRHVEYARCPDPYDYVLRVREGTGHVETPDGSQVPPGQVRPGRWVLLADLLGGLPAETHPERDPRLLFAETVTYTAPDQVAIAGGRNDRVQARLAQLMLEGI